MNKNIVGNKFLISLDSGYKNYLIERKYIY